MPDPERATSEMPVTFDGLFGWFSPGTRRRGVVLVGSLGFEQLRAHRDWRRLTGLIADTGCATLRFDLYGEGDSSDTETPSLAALTGAIAKATRFLREEAGIDEVVLVGLRIGATLSVLAAQEGQLAGGIDRLVLIAPYATGRTYLRALSMRARTTERLPDGTPLPQAPGIIAVGGFALPPALAAEIGAIDVQAKGCPKVGSILIAGPDNGLAARFGDAGVPIDVVPFPYLENLVSQPTQAGIPETEWAAIVASVGDGAAPRMVPAKPGLTEAGIEGMGWSERPIQFGQGQFGEGLFGILCRPSAPDPEAGRGPAFIFLNTATDPHYGYGRKTTELARQLAQAGSASLRMDIGGVGDSPDRPGGASPIYAPDALDDVRAAIDLMDAQGEGPLAVVGLCSGANLGFHAICGDSRVTGALLVNLYCFDWDQGDDVEAVIRDMVRSPTDYMGLLRRPDTWRRLAKGEIRIGPILSSLAASGARRLRGAIATAIDGRAARRSVGSRLEALRQRGARLHLVFSAGEPGFANIRSALGGSDARAAEQLGQPITVLKGADHNLASGEARETYSRLVLDLATALRQRGAAGRP